MALTEPRDVLLVPHSPPAHTHRHAEDRRNFTFLKPFLPASAWTADSGPLTLDGGSARRGRPRASQGEERMMSDELTEDELDELEALGAAEDADLIIGAVLGQLDA